jgi:pyruvate,orthophosphate dikinase
VTVRLLDPPLHEFLPRDAHQLAALAAELATEMGEPGGGEALLPRLAALAEVNPMLGLRGCRRGGVRRPAMCAACVPQLLRAAAGAPDALQPGSARRLFRPFNAHPPHS